MKTWLILCLSTLLSSVLQAQDWLEQLRAAKPDYPFSGLNEWPSPEKLKEARRLHSVLENALKSPPKDMPFSLTEFSSSAYTPYFWAERDLARHALKSNQFEMGLAHSSTVFALLKHIRNSAPIIADHMIVSAAELRVVMDYLDKLAGGPNLKIRLDKLYGLTQSLPLNPISKRDISGEKQAGLYWTRRLPDFLKDPVYFGIYSTTVDWPQEEILKFPFDSSKSEELVRDYYLHIEKWYTSGLPADQYQEHYKPNPRSKSFYQNHPNGLYFFCLDHSSDSDSSRLEILISTLKQRRLYLKILMQWLALESEGKKISRLEDLAGLETAALTDAFNGDAIPIDIKNRRIGSQDEKTDLIPPITVPLLKCTSSSTN